MDTSHASRSLAMRFTGWLVPLPVLLLLATACSDTSVGPDSGHQNVAEVIHLLSEAQPPGTEGSRLAEPVVVRVTDEEGNPMAQVPVRFSVIHGGGTVSQGFGDMATLDVMTDGQGLAQVEWTLGSRSEHILKVTGPREGFSPDPVYVFAGMNATMSLSWVGGIEFKMYDLVLSHDDRILETPHFLTFSDASTDDVKIAYAAMAEESLWEIMQTFEISSYGEIDLDQTDRTTKITIYTGKNLDERQMAFNRGFFLLGEDHSSRVYGPAEYRARFRNTIKHETMHVFQWLIGMAGRHLDEWTDVWFTEGIAEHISGGSFAPILTLEELESWRAHPDHHNPIAIHEWVDFPDSVEARGGAEYYPMFGLAVRYLLDEQGHGASYVDVKAMFLDIPSSYSFTTSFARYMGTSVLEYEDNFFDRITPYLEAQGIPSSHSYAVSRGIRP